MNMHSHQPGPDLKEDWMPANGKPLIIAGPCSAETENQVMKTAEELAKIPEVSVFRAGVWKPRTRPNGFEGVIISNSNQHHASLNQTTYSKTRRCRIWKDKLIYTWYDMGFCLYYPCFHLGKQTKQFWWDQWKTPPRECEKEETRSKRRGIWCQYLFKVKIWFIISQKHPWRYIDT